MMALAHGLRIQNTLELRNRSALKCTPLHLLASFPQLQSEDKALLDKLLRQDSLQCCYLAQENADGFSPLAGAIDSGNMDFVR